jgi:uncharacterized damage-inducible protein DinB
MIRWTDRISESQLEPSIEDDGIERSPSDLTAMLDIAAEELTLVAADIERSSAWERTIEFTMPDGKAYRFSKAAAMTHVLTHGMHHRAQALNMRRQLGLPPIGLDLDVVEWEAMQTGQLT